VVFYLTFEWVFWDIKIVIEFIIEIVFNKILECDWNQARNDLEIL
jgi:hypothetical protein